LVFNAGGGLVNTIGKIAVRLAMATDDELPSELEQAHRAGYMTVIGKVGSMSADKVVAAIETAVSRGGMLEAVYCHEHALYHAVIEAFQGVCRGQLELGAILRTVGLNFAVIKGPRTKPADAKDGNWLAVALYGTIGAPRKGFEHEVIGLGINHL
jgi:hut operon positive regulator